MSTIDFKNIEQRMDDGKFYEAIDLCNTFIKDNQSNAALKNTVANAFYHIGSSYLSLNQFD